MIITFAVLLFAFIVSSEAYNLSKIGDLKDGTCLADLIRLNGYFTATLTDYSDDDDTLMGDPENYGTTPSDAYDSGNDFRGDDDDDDAMINTVGLLPDGRVLGWSRNGNWNANDGEGMPGQADPFDQSADDDDDQYTESAVSGFWSQVADEWVTVQYTQNFNFEDDDDLFAVQLVTCNFHINCGASFNGAGTCSYIGHKDESSGITEANALFDQSFWSNTEGLEYYMGKVEYSDSMLRTVPGYGKANEVYKVVTKEKLKDIEFFESSSSSSSSSSSAPLTSGIWSGALATVDVDDLALPDDDDNKGEDDDDIHENDDDEGLVFALQFTDDKRVIGWARHGPWAPNSDDFGMNESPFPGASPSDVSNEANQDDDEESFPNVAGFWEQDGSRITAQWTQAFEDDDDGGALLLVTCNWDLSKVEKKDDYSGAVCVFLQNAINTIPKSFNRGWWAGATRTEVYAGYVAHATKMTKSIPYFGDSDFQWLKLSPGSRRSLGLPWQDDDDNPETPPSDFSSSFSLTSSSSSSSSLSSSSSSSFSEGNCLSKVLESGGVWGGTLGTLDDDDLAGDLVESDGNLGDDDDDIAENDDDDAMVFSLQMFKDGRLTGWSQSTTAWEGDDDDTFVAPDMHASDDDEGKADDDDQEFMSGSPVGFYKQTGDNWFTAQWMQVWNNQTSDNFYHYTAIITCNFQVDCTGRELSGSGVCSHVVKGIYDVPHFFNTDYWQDEFATVTEFYGGYLTHSKTLLDHVPKFGPRDEQWQWVSPKARRSLGFPVAQVTEDWYGPAYNRKGLNKKEDL